MNSFSRILPLVVIGVLLAVVSRAVNLRKLFGAG